MSSRGRTVPNRKQAIQAGDGEELDAANRKHSDRVIEAGVDPQIES